VGFGEVKAPQHEGGSETANHGCEKRPPARHQKERLAESDEGLQGPLVEKNGEESSEDLLLVKPINAQNLSAQGTVKVKREGRKGNIRTDAKQGITIAPRGTKEEKAKPLKHKKHLHQKKGIIESSKNT